MVMTSNLGSPVVVCRWVTWSGEDGARQILKLWDNIELLTQQSRQSLIEVVVFDPKTNVSLGRMRVWVSTDKQLGLRVTKSSTPSC